MLALHTLFEEHQFKTEFELIQWARKQKLIKPQSRGIPIELKKGEYKVPRLKKVKFKGTNPRTGRKKNLKKTTYLKTTIAPEDRTFKNLPRDSKKKAKVKFQDWLMLKNTSRSKYSVGQAASGAWLGWSHRAVGSFEIGKEINSDTIGNRCVNSKPYKIKTDDEAFEHAERFAKDVS